MLELGLELNPKACALDWTGRQRLWRGTACLQVSRRRSHLSGARKWGIDLGYFLWSVLLELVQSQGICRGGGGISIQLILFKKSEMY